MKMAKKKEPINKNNRYYKPSKEQKEQYAKTVIKYWNIRQYADPHNKIREFAKTLTEAANDTFDVIPPQQKQDYISKETWDLMQLRTKHIAENNVQEAKNLDKHIKKWIRAEKQQYKLDKLNEKDKDGYKWDYLKNLKKKFTPKTCKFDI